MLSSMRRMAFVWVFSALGCVGADGGDGPDAPLEPGPEPDASTEPGCGEGIKTRRLLETLDHPSLYIPIDIAAEQLARVALALEARVSGLGVHPLVADYTRPLQLPAAPRAVMCSP